MSGAIWKDSFFTERQRTEIARLYPAVSIDAVEQAAAMHNQLVGGRLSHAGVREELDKITDTIIALKNQLYEMPNGVDDLFDAAAWMAKAPGARQQAISQLQNLLSITHRAFMMSPEPKRGPTTANSVFLVSQLASVIEGSCLAADVSTVAPLLQICLEAVGEINSAGISTKTGKHVDVRGKVRRGLKEHAAYNSR